MHSPLPQNPSFRVKPGKHRRSSDDESSEDKWDVDIEMLKHSVIFLLMQMLRRW